MSFTTEIKNEICHLQFSKAENISLLSGFVRNNKIKDYEDLSLITENPKIARKIYSLFKEIYDICPEIIEKKSNSLNKKYFYNIFIREKKDIILKDLMIVDENSKKISIPKDYIIEGEDLSRAYLRGTFLAKGSINDPKTSRYHLEYMIDHLKEAKFISKILYSFDINNKIINRDNGYMVYVKEAEKIGDFLRIISANRAVLYYEDIRIYRDHKNMTNRLNNCEQANVDKIIISSNKEIDIINYILKEIDIDALDLRLQETIIYRKKYPDASLNDLSEIISKETGKSISKSGLNHRFRKLVEIKNKIEQNKKS